MPDRHTFGPRLRSERERRGITLETIEAATKVGVHLWAGLERNDFSRWPSGISARAFVRDYARVVGLDADEVVDEFCRLFPQGDRRLGRVIKAQAELIGHEAAALDELALLPAEGDRRESAAAQADADPLWPRIAPRAVAAALDVFCTVSLAAIGPGLVGAGFWRSLAIASLVYYSASTMAGGSPGERAVDILRLRLPALFAVHNRRAHA
jgi:transcriptional regulator with XRE-family HTH domain